MTAYLAWAALLAALVVLVLVAYRRPPRIEARREVPASAFEGQTLPLTLHLRVHAPLPVRVHIDDTPPLTVVPDVTVDLGGLLWGNSEHTVRTNVTTNRRGVRQWTAVRVRWADPFGLKWRTLELPLPHELEIYPLAHGLILPNLLRPLLSEGTLTRTIGLEDPLSLRAVREYVHGDPPTRVSWRLSARRGQLMVREPERTASSAVQVHLDLAGNGTYVDSATRLAASLIGEALESDMPVSVSTHTGATPSGRTPEALRVALRALAEAAPSDATARIPTPQPGSNLIVITQHASDTLVTEALRARAGASRVVIAALPEGFYLEPGETGRKVRSAPPDQIRELERRAGILAESGVLVFVLRGDQSILKLGG